MSLEEETEKEFKRKILPPLVVGACIGAYAGYVIYDIAITSLNEFNNSAKYLNEDLSLLAGLIGFGVFTIIGTAATRSIIKGSSYIWNNYVKKTNSLKDNIYKWNSCSKNRYAKS